MKLELITLSGEKLSEEVYEVTLSTTAGDISVFAGHEPLVTVAKTGALYVRRKKTDRDDARDIFAINGGVVQIDQRTIRILVDEAEAPDEIVTHEVEAALARAKEQRANAKDAISISEAEALMNRATTRLKVANLRRRR